VRGGEWSARYATRSTGLSLLFFVTRFVAWFGAFALIWGFFAFWSWSRSRSGSWRWDCGWIGGRWISFSDWRTRWSSTVRWAWWAFSVTSS
jgi:hypothetical protein